MRAQWPSTRVAECCLVFTVADYQRIRQGTATPHCSIEERDGSIYFLDRGDRAIQYIARVCVLKSWRVVRTIELAENESNRDAFPRDVDVASLIWAMIERSLDRFPEREWSEWCETFRTTAENDDPAVPMTAHERNYLIANAIFFRKFAMTCEKVGINPESA
jgi:hypothetical protein